MHYITSSNPHNSQVLMSYLNHHLSQAPIPAQLVQMYTHGTHMEHAAVVMVVVGLGALCKIHLRTVYHQNLNGVQMKIWDTIKWSKQVGK